MLPNYLGIISGTERVSGDERNYLKKKVCKRLALYKKVCYIIFLVSQQGRLAQLVERLPYKQDVTGSSPVSSIFNF